MLHPLKYFFRVSQIFHVKHFFGRDTFFGGDTFFDEDTIFGEDPFFGVELLLEETLFGWNNFFGGDAFLRVDTFLRGDVFFGGEINTLCSFIFQFLSAPFLYSFWCYETIAQKLIKNLYNLSQCGNYDVRECFSRRFSFMRFLK